MKLSVIIVSYNTCPLTLQTVRSIMKAVGKKSPLHGDFEIIVVDNDSQDKTVEKLEKLHLSHLKIINAHENLGFGRANNLGFKYATGQVILFLNSDTIVPAGSLEQVTQFCLERFHAERGHKKRLGLVAMNLCNADGSIQPQGGDLPNLWTVAAAMFFLDDLPVLRRCIPSVQHTGRRFNPQTLEDREFVRKGWVGGTAVAVHRDIWTDCGGWDPQIFMYGEDQELCYRMHQEKFYHGILTGAHVTHLGAASSSSAFAIHGELKGYLYFWRKYKNRQQWDGMKLILWLACWLRVVIYALKKDQKRVDIYVQGINLVEAAMYD